MKLAIRIYFIFLVAILTTSTKAHATHIYGGELLYTYLSGNTYEITLTLYGDCSGQNYPGLTNASPELAIFRGSALYDTLTLTEDTLLRKEVSPVCERDSGKTSCRSTSISALPGVTRFIFKQRIELPPSVNWRIVFDGEMNNRTQAGRSNSITNVYIGNGQLIYLVATLNNLNSQNSSPQYSSIPTPFYCINRPQQYNQGAIDPNDDSLVYSLTPALTNGSPTNYVPPYSGNAPLATAQNTFSFNAVSGQLSFLPNQVQRSLVVTKVEEYKDSVLIGSSMREMTFIVLDNCNNTPPIGNVDSSSIEGGASINNDINVCLSTPNLSLQIRGSDSDGNKIKININSVPEGATAKVLANNTPLATVQLDWPTGDVPLGAYNMYITYTDDACPLVSSQTIGYTIRIVKPISISHEVIQPTGCLFRQKVAIKLTDGLTPRIVTLKNKNGQILKTYTDTTGIIFDSLAKGEYFVEARSLGLLCKSYYQFSVTNWGTLPVKPLWENLNVCIGDKPDTLYAKPLKGSILNWYDNEGALLALSPTYSTSTPGRQLWYVTQKLDTCESARDSFFVTEHDLPNINILTVPERLCAGDSVQLIAEGGVRYEWFPDDVVEILDSITFARVRYESIYSVKGYSTYNCINTDTLVFDNVDKCCVFSYPDAFTPNGDGLNDGWKPICYGNTDGYRLIIVNRWGQRVFTSSDPDERWDGTFNGTKCEIGTYSYYFTAKCVNSRSETSKGAIILIR